VQSVIEQQPSAGGLDESDEAANSRVTPVMPAPNWWEFDDAAPANWWERVDDAPTLVPPQPVVDEGAYRGTAPRYSLLVSLAPPALAQPRSGHRAWGARLLFAAVLSAVVALLALEGSSLAALVPLPLTHALTFGDPGSP
jgi:hypothetical protein